MLSLHQVSKSFDGIRAVNNINLELDREKITGLIGPNGAGKTTLFNLISGFLRPDNGEILYQGKRIDGWHPWDVACGGIGRLFQDIRIFDRLTVLENVLTAFGSPLDDSPWAALLRRRRVNTLEREHTAKAQDWLRFVGLDGMENASAESLSYGQQKLLAIARLLAADSEMLLLDEPTAGINPQLRDRLLDLIRRLAGEQKKTVVVIEHNMRVIFDITDRICFMDKGKIIRSGRPEEILKDKELKNIYMGI